MQKLVVPSRGTSASSLKTHKTDRSISLRKSYRMGDLGIPNWISSYQRNPPVRNMNLWSTNHETNLWSRNFWVSGSNLSCISTVYIQFTLRNMLPNRIMVDFLSWNRTPQKCWGSNLYASLCQKEKREHAPRGAIWIASGDWEKIHDFSRVLVSAQHQALRLGVSPPILGMGGMSESLRIPVEEPWGLSGKKSCTSW